MRVVSYLRCLTLLALSVILVECNVESCVASIQGKVVCEHVPMHRVAEYLSQLQGHIDALLIACSPKEKQFSLADLNVGNYSVGSLQLIGCNFASRASDAIVQLAKHLSIVSSILLDISFIGTLHNLESMTFANNTVLYPGADYKNLPFNFFNASRCKTSDSNSSRTNCFCEENKNYSTMIFVGIFCFEEPSATVLQVASALVAANRSIHSIKLFSVPFLLMPEHDRDIYNLSADTIVGSLKSFEVYTCQPLKNPKAKATARRELRSLYAQFKPVTYGDGSTIDKRNMELQKMALVYCPEINVLRLIDGEDRYDLHNPATHLMRPIRFAPKLRTVNLEGNNLSMDMLTNQFFEGAITTLVTEDLNFARNSLPELPKRFGTIWSNHRLTSLNLSQCEIEELHEQAFVDLTTLVKLDLSHNDLTFLLPGAFRGLTNLQYLNLSRNRIYGVRLFETYFSKIWPSNLIYLDLSRNMLIDAKDPVQYGKPQVFFTDKFFTGLENLLYLNLQYTSIVYGKEHFKPLRSLQTLIVSDTTALIYNSVLQRDVIPLDAFFHLPTLRKLSLANTIADGSWVFTNPCQLFRPLRILRLLDISNRNWKTKFVSAPPCDETGVLYSWYTKKHSQTHFHLVNQASMYCGQENGEKANMFEYWSKKFNDTDYINDGSWYNCTRNGSPAEEEEVIAITSNWQAITPVDDPLKWSNIKLPVIFIIIFTVVIILIIAPTSVLERMKPLINDRLLHSTIRTRPTERLVNRLRSKMKRKRSGALKKVPPIKYLKKQFYYTTLFNGFSYVYMAHWSVEKATWYIVILFFTCLFAYDASNLWVQYHYGAPQTSVSMVNAPTFSQQPFTVCLPLPQRHIDIDFDDIVPLFTKDACEIHDNSSDFKVDLLNRYAMSIILARVGLQMAREATSLHREPEIPDWVVELDKLLHAKNLTYFELLGQLSSHLCDVLHIRAFTHARGDLSEKRTTVLNTAGCRKIFSSELFGLSWYDQLVTNQTCLRFPGLFEFEGYDIAGTLVLGPLELWDNADNVKIDFAGYNYPITARKVGLPILAPVHRKTLLQIQVKSRILNLEYFRSDSRRCYKNCLATKRIEEIEKNCQCRPFMWPDYSKPGFKECSPSLYKICNLSLNIPEHECSKTIPCDYWDYSVTTLDLGPTEDNYTELVFGGANTMFIIYEEVDGKTLHNFLGDVGGVMGLWLGASVMACVHVLVFFVKMIYLMVRAKLRGPEDTDNTLLNEGDE